MNRVENQDYQIISKLLYNLFLFSLNQLQTLFKFKLMNHLAYIPNKSDKQQLNYLLAAEKREQSCSQKIVYDNQPKQDKKISTAQLKILLDRLTKNTKKQYQCQQQITHIITANKLLKKRQQGQKVQNRLIAFGKQRDNKVQQLADQLEKEQKQIFFRQTPQICEKSQKLKQRPIERRLQVLIKQRERKLEEKKEKYEPSFHPNVNPHSQFINEIQNLGDLYNRMRTREQEAEKRKELNCKKILMSERQNLTFKPCINQKSRQIAQTLPQRSTPGTPFQSLHSAERCIQVFPFAPTINKNTEKILEGRQMDQNCFKRLYNNARELSLKNSIRRQQSNRANSFHPSLNRKSLKIVSSNKNHEIDEIMTEKDQEEIQQVKVGNKVELNRGKSYSLRDSSGIKQNWCEDQENKTTRQCSIKNLLKMKLLR